MLYYFYSSIAGIALVVHLIINWQQLVNWRNVNPRAGATEFRHFLVCLLFFFVWDVLWGVFAHLKWSRFLYADTVVFFMTMALSVYSWTRFITVYLKMDGRLRAYLLWAGLGLLEFFAIGLVVNSFTGIFFTVDTQCVYKAGPLRQLAFVLLIAFNALNSVVTLLKLLRTEGAIRRRYKMVFAFGITMSAAIVIQIGDAFLPLYSIGCLFGCCLLHVFVVEDEHDEMHRQELLAREYEAQLESEHSATSPTSAACSHLRTCRF